MTTSLDSFFPREWGIDVVAGPVPARLASPTRDDGIIQMAPGEFLAAIPGVGRVHVTAHRVTVDVDPGHDVSELGFLLYGWAPRCIRILRCEFSLHASAVLAGGSATAIMGRSGAGKSTTVAALAHRGCALLIDDIVPVDLVDDRLVIRAWPRPVHLTADAARRLGLSRDVPVTEVEFLGKLAAGITSADGSWPLRVIVELSPGEEANGVTARMLRGRDKVQAVLNHTQASGLAAADGRAPAYFAWAMRVAQSARVYRVTRPASGWHLDDVLDRIADIIAETGGSATVPGG